MMKTSNILALAFACLPNLSIAKCFGGSNTRPDHGLEVVSFFYDAGCELQQNPLAGGTEFLKKGTSTDGKCLNVLVKNHGDTKTVTSDQAVDAWIREWVGCEHGGKSSYDDKLEYV